MTLRRSHLGFLAAALLLAGASPVPAQAPAAEAGSVPLAEWIREGERQDFGWDLDVEGPRLRMDQRHEVAITAAVKAGDLGESVTGHPLSLVAAVTGRDGEWLAGSPPVQESLGGEAHRETRVELEMYLALTPGEYVLWIALHDQTTGLRNVDRRNVSVDRINDDPLPLAYADFPQVEFAQVEKTGGLTVRLFGSDLAVPVASARPLEVELIAVLSAPEQWPGGAAFVRHTENVLGGLTALSQMDLTAGSLSLTGLDLLRREVVLEHRPVEHMDTLGLVDAFDAVNRSPIPLEALMESTQNAAFLRKYIEERVAGHLDDSDVRPSGGEKPLRVLILLGGVMRFEDDSDLSPVELEGACDCRVYHVRFKQELQDLFDQVDDVLEPFDPPTFDVFTPRDFRKAIGEIVRDLERS